MDKLPPKNPLDPLNTQATKIRTFFSTLISHSTCISSDHISLDTDSSDLYINTCVTRGNMSQKSEFLRGTFQNY